MEWLFKPKVQLGLFVNFVFVMFTLVSSSAGERIARVRSRAAAIEAESVSIPRATPAPYSYSGSVLAYDENGRTQVGLHSDFTLIKRSNFMLTLAPSFSVRKNPLRELSAVSLRFVRFSDAKPNCPGDCPLTIEADGARVWPSRARTAATQWQRERLPHFSPPSGGGPAADAMAAEVLTADIPFDVFLQIITADRVKLSLGPDKAELTSEQLEAMRAMCRQVTEAQQKIINVNGR